MLRFSKIHTKGCVTMLTNKEKIVLDELITLHTTDNSIPCEATDSIAGISHNELGLIFHALSNKGLIKMKSYTDGGYRISLTYEGLSYKETEVPSSSKTTIVNNFNAPITNSAVANSGSVSINNGATIQEIKDFIQQQSLSPEEKLKLNEVVTYVEALIESDTPLKKNFLAKFSDILAKHSNIAEMLMKIFIHYFTGLSL